MRLIALGRSVRDCAHILELAQSTVDNHKSRLMKKLGLRKSQDLTRLAIREGLIRI
jgi:DNA-binding NarL/FixJ family response regulator